MPHDDTLGSLLRNAVLLQRLQNSVARDSAGIIRALFDEIVAELAKLDPTQPKQITYRRSRVDKLVERVEELAGQSYDGWTRHVRDRLVAIGKDQQARAAQLLLATVGEMTGVEVRTAGLSVNMLKSIIDTDPFQGETLRQWASTQQSAVVRRVRREVQLGMAREERIDQLTARVRGRVLRVSQHDADAIVRTAVNHIASTAQFETYAANRGVTTHYQWVSTLDSRTTPICISLANRVFRYDDPGAPKPPAHVNCRSALAPVVDWESLGLEPPPEGTRAARDASGRTVQVPASWDYADWLRRQPKRVQEEVLGVRRAELFRSGKMSLRELVTRDGRFVPVEKLPT